MSKKNISIGLAVLFHLSGLIGILYTPYKDWFVQNTTLNLLLMFVLLIWNQEKPDALFLFYLLLCFMTGMVAEIIGVNTGILFGHYSYGKVMGFKIAGVPLLIGLNWFVVVYSCMILMEKLHFRFRKKYEDQGMHLPSPLMETLSVVVDGALLATFFDWLMEPVAIKLGFWQWQTSDIPNSNYISWFVISAMLIAVSRGLKFNKQNQFAVHLMIIQSLFFFTLRIFL